MKPERDTQAGRPRWLSVRRPKRANTGTSLPPDRQYPYGGDLGPKRPAPIAEAYDGWGRRKQVD